MQPLGDPHNFGKRVALTAEDQISKPRNLFWEWLFLSSASPFRRLIDRAASTKGVTSPFRLFPDLAFTTDSLIAGGTVSRLKLTPFSARDITPGLCESVGSVIGLVTAMGIADLHRQNVVFGIDESGRPIFAPLDIESALETYSLPSQTHLLPSTEEPSDLCGFAGFLKIASGTDRDLSITTAFAHGYLTTVELVLNNAAKISETFSALDQFKKAPVRLFLRATRQYYSWLEQTGRAIEPPLHESEWEQLKRGDIPYFVRFLDSKEIMYFHEPATLQPANLASALTDRGLANSITFQKDVLPRLFEDPKKTNDLLKAGVLQLLRFCDGKRQTGRSQYGDVTCEFSAEEMFVTWRDKLKVKCARK